MSQVVVSRVLAGVVAALAVAVALLVSSGDAEAQIDLDLRDWSQQGVPEWGEWDVAGDGSAVIQTTNHSPTFFVSPETLTAGAEIEGVIEVQTSSDDDYVGFVFGYQGPHEPDETGYDFLAFNWKQNAQLFDGCEAQEGMSLVRLQGEEDPTADYTPSGDAHPALWCHDQAEIDARGYDMDLEILDTNWGDGTGWEDNTEYRFTLHYTSDRVRIHLDDQLVFDETGSFPDGHFGFYNYSQSDVRYSGFTETEPDPDPDPSEGADRLAGGGRLETAVEIARDSFPRDGAADAVMLARADVFADALAGTPLAVDRHAPMLITHSGSLASPVADEIQRVLGDDPSKTVYLLGGPAALSDAVAQQVGALGYQVQRLAGGNRFETAIAIADELGTVDKYLITTGGAFPDALSAGPAAAVADGAVLLSAGDQPVGVTDAYLAQRSHTDRFAIGGPAARAYGDAEPVVGSTREGTAVAVAERFFDGPPAVGVAQSGAFPDALTGGAHIGALTAIAGEGGPMLLTPSTSLAGPVADYLCATDSITRASVYGGTGAIADSVIAAVDAALDGSGCDGDEFQQEPLTGASRLHTRGVGVAHAGMTLHEVEAATGTTLEVQEFDTFGGRCYYAQPQGVSAYSLLVLSPGDEAPDDPHDGVVARATTTGFGDSFTSTEAGIEPGDTRTAVEAAYGADNLTESQHTYQPDGVYLDYHIDDGDHGLRFEVGGDDVVQTIHGGDGDAIMFPEGCA